VNNHRKHQQSEKSNLVFDNYSYYLHVIWLCVFIESGGFWWESSTVRIEFYVNGLPNDFVTWSTGYKFSDITINNVYVPIDFTISGASGNVLGSDEDYLFNGVVETKPYYLLVTSQGTSLTISADYIIDAATSTSSDATEISISFVSQSKSIDPNVQRYYVILDVPYQGEQEPLETVRIMNYSNGYRFIIKTDVEKFVTVIDETNKYYRLIYEKACLI